jgi:hypothetical protein
LSVTGDISASGDVTASAFSGDGSQLTNVAHPDITPGSNISVNLSNGNVLQDLTITLDGDGHVTATSTDTANLDLRYYTETEADTIFATPAGVSGSFSNNAGTVTSVTAGSGLNGGEITNTGTISVDSGSMLPYYSGSIFGTVSGDVLIGADGAATIQANSVALSTDTTGDFVNSITGGTGIASTGGTSGENISHTLSIDLTEITVSSGLTAANATTLNLDLEEIIATDDANRVLTSDGDGTLTGEANLLFDGSKLTVTGEVSASGNGLFDGLVGIGIASPTADLHISGSTADNDILRVQGGTTDIIFASGSGNVGIGTITPDQALHVVGEIVATGEITAFYSSDERLKENIQILSTPLTKLTSLRGVEFDWTDEHIDSRGGLDKLYVQKHDVGVIAQEVEKVLPEVVVDRDDGYKAVRYEKMIPLLIEAIKELKTELDEVKQNCRCNSQLEE